MSGLERFRQLSFGLLFFMVVGFIAAVFFIDVGKYLTKPEESLVINGTYIRILKNGKLRWEVWTRKIVVDPKDEQHSLEGIYKGIFYRDKKPPFHFHAGRGTYNRRTEEVFLKDGIDFVSDNGDYFKTERVEWYGRAERLVIPAPLELSLDGNVYKAGELESIGADLKRVTLTNKVHVEILDAEASGSKSAKEQIAESELDGKYLKNITLEAERVEYQSEMGKTLKCYPVEDWRAIHVPGEPQFATGQKRVKLSGAEFDIKSMEMFLDLEKKYAHLQGAVKMIKMGKKEIPNDPEADPEESRTAKKLKAKDTMIDTEEVLYYWEEGAAQFPLDLMIYQDELDIAAGKGYVNSKNDTVFLSEGVKLRQAKGSSVVKEDEEGNPREDDDPAMQETTVTCQMMDLNFETEDFNARGDVLVVQEKRRLAGAAASYEKSSMRWVVYGEPALKEDDRTMSADMFVYDEGGDFFEALGRVTADFKIDDGDMDEINDYYKERDGAAPGPSAPNRGVMMSEKLQYDRKKDIVTSDTRTTIKFRDMEIEADKIRVDREGEFATGTGNVIIKDVYTTMHADSFEAAGKNKKVKLTGKVRMSDKGRPDPDGGKPGEPFELMADRLEYDRDSARGVADGGVVVVIEKGGRRVTAKKLDLDRKNKIYKFFGGTQFHQDSGDWLQERGLLDEKDEKAGKITKRATDITCDNATINDAEKTARFEGDVVIAQKGKKLQAELVELDDGAERFSASGKVYLEQDNGEWLFEDGLVEDDTEEDMKDRLKKGVQINAGSMESLYGEKKIFFDGGVKITQGRAKALAQSMWHFEETKQTALEGKVQITDEEGREMKASRIVYDGKKKTTEAFGAVSGRSDIIMD